MHTLAIAESGYRNLPLSMLDESSTNPRRTFEPAKLVELAHSVTVHGLIQPITVRPKGDRFEVVAGARRFRAAQIAELIDVPTRILELSDEQTLEVQIIENSQRQRRTPLRGSSRVPTASGPPRLRRRSACIQVRQKPKPHLCPAFASAAPSRRGRGLPAGTHHRQPCQSDCAAHPRAASRGVQELFPQGSGHL